jgi:hypothetical protein
LQEKKIPVLPVCVILITQPEQNIVVTFFEQRFVDRPEVVPPIPRYPLAIVALNIFLALGPAASQLGEAIVVHNLGQQGWGDARPLEAKPGQAPSASVDSIHS